MKRSTIIITITAFTAALILSACSDSGAGSSTGDYPLYLDKLITSDGESSDSFGCSVDIDGNYAVVGAYGDGSYRGAVYVYQRSGSYWTQVARLTASDRAANDYFGSSVSISGYTVIVGAYQDDNTDTNYGAAYVYRMPAEGWVDTTQTTKITAADSNNAAWFGYSVAIDDDFAIVGAYYDNDNGTGSGSAYIFELSGSGWTLLKKIKAGGTFDFFGCSVAIDGDYAVVGSRGDDDIADASGAAYVFQKSTTYGWANPSQVAKLTASDGSHDEYFGYSVAINGDSVIVGTDPDEDKSNSPGVAYVFEKPSSGWSSTSAYTAKLTASDGAVDDWFGYSVAISDDYAVVGAYKDDDKGSSSGSVYLFQKPTGGWATTDQYTSKLIASDGESSDRLGCSVAAKDGYLISGAIGDRSAYSWRLY